MDQFTSQYQLLLACICISMVSLSVYYLRQPTNKLPLPPSPKSDPIIGHLRYMPTSSENDLYTRWGKELNSDIISLNVLGDTIIILNSAKAAYELLDQRSAIYSDRPKLPMISYPDLNDWTKNTGFMPYSERWRSQRRMTHASMHKKASMQFWPMIVKQTTLGLQRLVENPENLFQELRRMPGTTLLSAVYGYEVTGANDPLVQIVETANSHLSESVVPGNFLVNAFPWLRYFPNWFPGTEWKRTVKEWSIEKDQMADIPFEWTKEQMASGTAPPSMVNSLLSELENSQNHTHDLVEEEDRIKWVTGTLYLAGSDTSVASILVFVLAMILNPEVQSKARAEIEQVIGTDRLPEMDDRESLPYLGRVMKEVMRWQSVVPLGIAHACTQEDEYRGYRIPKGATVIANIKAISNDKSIYINPEQFNPDRFLESNVPDAPAFGFGRRSCPGIHMAESTLFITMSSLLAVFDIRPAIDEQGNEVMPVVDMSSNVLLSQPAEFKYLLKPRSEKTIQLLNNSFLSV